MIRIVSVDIAESAGCDLTIERSILGPDVELTRHFYSGDENQLISTCRHADVVLTDLAPLTSKVVGHMQQCQLISVAGTGYSNIDLEAAIDANISVCAIDEYCTEEVADHVLLLMLVLCRRFTEYHDQVQRTKLWQADSLTGLCRLRDMTLGIVGFGKIGRAVAYRAHAFGMKIIAHSQLPDQRATSSLNVRYCNLPTLLAKSDIISLNCTLTKENKHLIDANAFLQMARKPLLINCARGGLIDERALVDALDSGQISGAGLDVLVDEPPDLSSSRIVGRSNVILTPHVAYYSDKSVLESRRISARNIRNFLDGNHKNVQHYIYQAAR